MTSTFAGSWNVIQQPTICCLTAFMVGWVSYGLHGLSPFTLDSLTLNFSYVETSTEALFVELYPYITYCVSEHQCLVSGHLGSVGMIMRILTMTVIIAAARCTEQTVCVGNAGTYRQLKFWNRRHDTEFIACGSYYLYSAPLVRGLVAGQSRPQRLPALPLRNTKIDSSHYCTLYNMKHCFIRISIQFGFPVGPLSYIRVSLRNEQPSLAFF
jgi:hypothetical protein